MVSPPIVDGDTPPAAVSEPAPFAAITEVDDPSVLHRLLERLLQNVPGVLFQFRLAPDGGSSFPYASDGIRGILGVTPVDARLDAAPVFAVLHPDDSAEFSASIKHSADTLSLWDHEFRVVLGERGLRWLAGRARPARLSDGSVLWHGFITDITERKSMQTALLNSEALAQATLDAASAETCVLDPDGRILAINEAWRRFYVCNAGPDAPEDSSLGSNYLHVCDQAEGPDRAEAAAMAAGIRAVISGEREQYDLEYPCHSPVEPRWFIARAARFRDGSNNVVVTHENITQRKLIEQRETHRSHVLQMLADHAPLAAVLDAITRDVEAINPTMLCSILLLDESGRHLRMGSAPSLPTFYNQAIDGLTIGPGVGSCGNAAYQRQRTVVEDVMTHPWWRPFRELAQQAELRSCWSEPIISAEGKVLGTFAIYHRIPSVPSERDLALIEHEARLVALALEKTAADAQLHLAASVFSHAREGIMITNIAGQVIDVNETFTRITGYERCEAVGQRVEMLRSERHPPEFYRSIVDSLSDKAQWYGEVWVKRRDGEIFPAMVTISAVRGADGQTSNYVALFTDITLMKQHQQQLEHIAHYDVLTGLPNRVLLADRLSQAIAYSRRRNRSIGVVFLDLDGFKSINDTHGHTIGDRLLIQVAQRIKSVLRETDTLARIGGDEFVVVLGDLGGLQDCEPLLERMLKAAATPVRVCDLTLHVSTSMGVTLYPHDNVEPELLVRHADQAMYVAKQAGKNRYHLFDVVRDAAFKTRLETLENIRRGLHAGEFLLYYQPKINMRTGSLVGAEALIRWQHPQRGLLTPSAFLPVIEDHPLSMEFSEWVIATALAQMALWHKQGMSLRLSVNVGARELQEPTFVARLAALLASNPPEPPCSLELEVLETSAMEDITQVHRVMHACRELGVQFAIDDFGTGYSSLTYLKHLPADTLKIDRSFVLGMLGDTNDRAIVKGIVGLADAFHRQVIAEGVETSKHGAVLLSLGCEQAQGFGISLPMTAEKLPEWVVTWGIERRWNQ